MNRRDELPTVREPSSRGRRGARPPTPDRPDPARAEAVRKRLKRLAWLLDSAIPLPGGARIGLDGLLGLVPALGDVVGALLSSYIVIEAARLRVPGRVLARMVANVLVELAVGTVPVAGDVFDMAFKANERNVRLLEECLGPPPVDEVTPEEAAKATPPRRTSGWRAAAVILAMVLFVVAVLALGVAVVGLVWQAASGSA